MPESSTGGRSGNLAMSDRLPPIAWGVAAETGVAVVSVDYRLAPKHPFPAALEDCHAVVSRLAEHGERFGVQGDRLALWGDSAGGNLAAATCLMARDRGGPTIVAQALNYPCLTDDLTSDSYRRYAESPGLRTANMDWGWGHYLGDRRPTDDPYAAPLKAEDLSRLPRPTSTTPRSTRLRTTPFNTRNGSRPRATRSWRAARDA